MVDLKQFTATPTIQELEAMLDKSEAENKRLSRALSDALQGQTFKGVDAGSYLWSMEIHNEKLQSENKRLRGALEEIARRNPIITSIVDAKNIAKQALKGGE